MEKLSNLFGKMSIRGSFNPEMIALIALLKKNTRLAQVSNFFPFIVHKMVCDEIFLYLTREFYCFVNYINIQIFNFASCEILKARELPKHQW